VRAKYSSVQTAIARIKTRLRTFPTPRYIRIIKRVREVEVIKPLRDPAKIREKVKRSEVKKATKNRGITPKVSGSTK